MPAANGLVPGGLTVDGMNYRDTAGDVTPAAVDARALYLTARQTLTTSDFNKVSLDGARRFRRDQRR